MKKYFFITIFSLAALFIASCTKKNNLAPVPTGHLYFHLHTDIDSFEVGDYNSVIQATNGRNISLSLAQMYISNIELVKLDGSIYPVTNKVILKHFDHHMNNFTISNAASGIIIGTNPFVVI